MVVLAPRPSALPSTARAPACVLSVVSLSATLNFYSDLFSENFPLTYWFIFIKHLKAMLVNNSESLERRREACSHIPTPRGACPLFPGICAVGASRERQGRLSGFCFGAGPALGCQELWWPECSVVVSGL